MKVEFKSDQPAITGIVIRKLGRYKAWGMAHPDTGIIEIDQRAVGRKFLETLIHESHHLLQPYLCEDAVTTISAELARVLWEQGFRKSDNDISIKLQDEEE
jgi:hypothetical protein